MFHRSVCISSRYQNAAEIATMASMVDALEADVAFVESLFCDSKAGANYSVRLVTGDQADANRIVAKLDAFLVETHGGHNGIFLSGPGSVDGHAPPNYREFGPSGETRD